MKCSIEQETVVTYSQTQQITILRETVASAYGKITRALSGIGDKDIDQMDIENFLEYIEQQRLTAMPHRGCHWDRVLKWAEFFALQISGYAKAIESFVPSSQKAAKLILTCCYSLIEVSSTSLIGRILLKRCSLDKIMLAPFLRPLVFFMNSGFPFR